MKFRILSIALVLLVGGIVLGNHPGEATRSQPTAEQEALILASTIQIAMFESPQPGGNIRGERGLGTLVAYGEEPLIVTHDHWLHLMSTLDTVELRSATGQLLVTLSAQEFRALIVYRDGGVLVFLPPLGLDVRVPATLGMPTGEGSTVWVVRRAPATNRTSVEVIPATVMAVESAGRSAKLWLRSQDGSTIIPGDSGGGVWVEGKLVANLWAFGVKTTHFFWNNWFGNGQTHPTDLILAGLQPVGSQIGVAPDQAADAGARVETKEDQLRLMLIAD